jgi:hypothetical protein
VLAAGGDGGSGLNRFGSAQRNQALLKLQRMQGNSSVQRLLDRAALSGTAAVQRHTSVELEEPENAIRRLVDRLAIVQRDLAAEISEATSGWGTDEDAIYDALDRASATEKTRVLNMPTVIADLRDELSGDELGRAMVKLGQPLADQIDYAISGAGTDEGALFYAIENSATPDSQRQLVCSNPQLLVRLRDDLSRGDAGRAMRGLKASLTEQLYAAVEGLGTDEQGILDAIGSATPTQRAASLADRGLITRLAEDLNTTEMIATLKALGSSLADRLNIAMDGWGTDEEAIYAIAEEATPDQRREILGNSALMARLRDELTQSEMLRTLTSLGGSLADMIDICLSDNVDSQRIISMITDADDTQRLRIKENSALVARLEASMPPESYAQVCELVGIEPPATDTGEIAGVADGGGADAGVPDAGVPDAGTPEAGEAAEPEEPATLVGKVSQALDAAPPNAAAALAAIAAASADERASVADDTALRERLYGALSQAQLMQVMTDLGIGIASRLDALLNRSASVADLQAHIAAASDAEKRTVLNDRVLVERLTAYAGEAERNALLVALGDSPGNQVDQLLADNPTLAAMGNIIAAASEPDRQGIVANSGLMMRIKGEFTDHEFLQIQFLLIYGTRAAIPAQVATLLTALEGTPTIAAIRSPLGNMAEADVQLVKTAVREYMRPHLSDADFSTLLRMLDQGLLDLETLDEDWNETLQVGDIAEPDVVFAPREFTGNRGFDVGYYRDRVEVTVRIGFSAPFWDRQAVQDLPGLMQQWETMIEAAWDSKFSLRNSVRTLPIRINMVPNGGSPHHEVNVGSATDVSWPGYNTANWYYRATAYNHAQAPLHEFGHMLGNPDEYNLSPIDFTNTVGTAPTAANATTETDTAGATRHTERTSLMGGGGTVERRHLNYFTNWLNAHRLSGEPAYTLV